MFQSVRDHHGPEIASNTGDPRAHAQVAQSSLIVLEYQLEFLVVHVGACFLRSVLWAYALQSVDSALTHG